MVAFQQVSVPGAVQPQMVNLASLVNPNIQDPAEAFRQGQRGALATRLAESQEARAQAGEERAITKAGQQTEAFQLQKKNLQGDLSDQQFKSAVTKMNLVGSMSDMGQRAAMIEDIKASVKGNPMLENIVSTVAEMPPEQSGKFFDDLKQFSQDAGFMEGKTAGQDPNRVLSSEILDDGTTIQSTPSGPKVFSVEGVQLQGKEAAAAVKTARDLKVQQQKEIAQIKQDIKGQNLTPGMMKVLDASQTDAMKASKRVNQINALADDFGKIRTKAKGGVVGSLDEYLKRKLGSQDEVTNLKTQFWGLRASEAVNNLPPGVASDKDIELALSGFPAADAPPVQVESFLRGAQKMATADKVYNTFKSKYISEHGDTRGMVTAWEEEGEAILSKAVNKIPKGPLELKTETEVTTPDETIKETETITIDENTSEQDLLKIILGGQ